MRELTTLQTLLDQAPVDAAARALRRDHRARWPVVDGIEPRPRDADTEQLLERAEALVAGAGAQPGWRRTATDHHAEQVLLPLTATEPT